MPNQANQSNQANHPEASDSVVVRKEGRRPSASPRILITNDDGIQSEGLRRLAYKLAENHEVVVAAPDEDRSGSGTSIGRFNPSEGVALKVAELEGIEAYAVAGPPGLAVMAGALGAFGRAPDLVVSGVNAGTNTGHSVIHSGTVGGALTAHTFGCSGLALSQVPSDPWHWDTAAEIALPLVDWLLSQEGDPQVLNVNVPARTRSALAGARWAKLDSFGYFRVALADKTKGRVLFEVSEEHTGEEADTDSSLCQRGYVTITPLVPLKSERRPEASADAICGL